MHSLVFMGVGPTEEFRGRVYGAADLDEDESRRRAFLFELADGGVLDCPAYDGWIHALQDAGWVPREPEFEPVPGGKHARWRLTAHGYREWRRMAPTEKP